MTSTIKLYKAPEIQPARLFVIDALEEYLSGLTKIEISNFQYVRHGLKITIKINKSQSSLEFLNDNLYNYCSIDNGSLAYYFIMKPRQIASETIELDLEMDTINTFKPGVAFTILDKTTINRQHKDRFKSIPASNENIELYGTGTTAGESSTIYRYTYTYTNPSWKDKILSGTPVININTSNVGYVNYSFDSLTGTMQVIFQSSAAYNFSFTITFILRTATRVVMKIDLLSEGLTPILYGKNIKEITGDDSNHWYLVYKGTSNVVALAYPENPVTLYIPGTSTITPQNLTAGTYYYLMEDRTSGANRISCSITSSNGKKYAVSYFAEGGFIANRYRNNFIFYTSGGKIYAKSLVKTNNPVGQWITRYSTEWEECDSITLAGNSIIAHTLTSYTETLSVIYGGSTYEFQIAGGAQSLKTFSSVNRSESDLVKIINLPYAPLDISDVSPEWTYNSTYGTLQMNNPDIRLNSIIEDETNPLNILNVDISPDPRDEKEIELESKLFHSDYFQIKFVYDSFTKIFALERMNLDYYVILKNTPFYFTFVATNTINSNFVFDFTQYNTDDFSFDDFEHILIASRNNEVVIYNSDYLNYIKNGFNYDVKTKQRQEAGQWIGVGLSLVGAVASFASSGVTSGFGIAGGITLATTAMAQLTRAVNSTAQAEATQNQKLLQLRQQKDSVFGADDIDLMTYYCNNKAKLMLYQCSEAMKKALFDLFFYTGYICGYKGIPNYTSRTRFNFVSCELEISPLININQEYIKDLKIKYSAGVTFIHHYDNEWDTQQLYENWETSLY